MPGMMDSILDLGLSDAAAEGLARVSGNAHFAYDSYRRLIQMYGEVVDGIDGHLFEEALSTRKAALGVEADTDLSADDLKELVETYKSIYVEALGRPVSAGRARPASRGDRGRLPFLAEPPRAGVSAAQRHSRHDRHRRERRPDGVRQLRPTLGDRCCLLPRPGER